MCAPLAVLAPLALTVGSGAYKAYSQYQEGVAESKMYGYQADVARQTGELALKTGQKQSEVIQDVSKVKSKQLISEQAEFNASQKAAAAGAGVTGGTMEDIISNTFTKEKLDELSLRYNADVNSWETMENAKNTNWTQQNLASQYDYAKKNAKQAGARNAFSTLLGTAASVALGGAISSGSTSGVSGWLKGYKSGTPKGAVDMGTWTKF